MRLKVSWKEHKLIVPSGDTNDKISRLLKDIANRFQPFADPSLEFLISELRTADGFLVSPHITIADALIEGDYLVAIDFETWKTEQYKLCNKYFFGNSLSNFEDSTSVSCSIGLHTQNKLYCSITQGKKLLRLDLFDSSDLRSFSKEGKHLITHWEDEKGNSVKLYFNVKGQTVVSIESELKTFSSKQADIHSYDLKISPKGQIEAGEVKHLQFAYDNTPLPLATVDAELRTGASYPDYDIDYYNTNGGNAGSEEKEFATVTSSSGLRYEQQDITRAELSASGNSNNGNCFNSFYTDFQIVNTGTERITITKITAEYQNKEGAWVAVPAFFGLKNGNGNYSYQWRWENTLVPLPSRETIKLSTNTRIEIPKEVGKNYERLYRSHQSLPNTINFKITVLDDTQSTTVIPLKYQNKTEFPVFITEKYKIPRLSSSDGTMVYFQTLDDFVNNYRAYVQILTKVDQGDKVLVYSSNLQNSYFTIRQNLLHDFAYTATKANEKKHRIPDYSYKGDLFELNVFAIVDLEKRRTIAFCFELENSDKSAKSLKYYPIPDLSNPKTA